MKLNNHINLRALICFLLSLPTIVNAQWQVFHYSDKPINVISIISKKNNELKKGFTFFDISSDLNKDVIKTGYEAIKKDSVWISPLNLQGNIIKKRFYANFYSENVKGLKFEYYGIDGVKYCKYLKVENNGYQMPVEFSLEKCENTKMPEINSKKVSNKASLITTAIFNNTKEKGRIVFGEFNVCDIEKVRIPSEGIWFNELTKKQENKILKVKRDSIGSNHSIKSWGEVLKIGGSGFIFELDTITKNNICSHKQVLSLINKIFENYQLYDEHNIDRGRFLREVQGIIIDTIPFAFKLNKLEIKSQELRDAHFAIKFLDKPPNRDTSPLILKRIKNNIIIVGIRDEQLKNKIALGARLLTIDNRDMRSLLDTLSLHYYGSYEQRTELAVAKMLDKPIGSSPTIIKFEDTDGSLKQTEIRYDKFFLPPVNFIPTHFSFTDIGNDWKYLRINSWGKGSWIKFYNLRQELRNSKGIVFDLRGNPGGFDIEAMDIASTFIKQEEVYSTLKYFSGKTEYSVDNVLKPNPYLNLSELEIIFLVDNRTACASEAFVTFLNTVRQATIIGTSPTAGAYSVVYSLELPEKIRISGNIFAKYFGASGRRIEYNPLHPHVLVEIEKYQDLFGYQDKVLLTAKKILTGQFN
ncbi:S41 family peptidase [Sphingobacterium multivorum]|uniref:S41 family peptidase n=1 Tax=Sphingobacterium multivorum TaxID=28454 RepID=UPI0028ABDABD|nr:S41 family peptidase [Sphingobacterium multivorum]